MVLLPSGMLIAQMMNRPFDYTPNLGYWIDRRHARLGKKPKPKQNREDRT